MSSVRFRRRSTVTEQSRRVARHPFVARRDSAMLLLLIVALLAWAFTVRQMDRSGAFDGSGEFKPVGDSRKRFHADEDIATHRVLDAVPWGDRLVVTLGNGQNLQYDPGMDLWDELPPLPASFRDRRAVQIRAGNGHRDEPFDASRDRLFARTPTGGLAVLVDGDWRVVSHDTQFLGFSGRPVPWSDVTAAAVSGDRRFVLLGCRTQGIGLYDVRRRVWIKVADLATLKSAGAIREIVWWQASDRFVLAGERQLVLFRADAGSDGDRSGRTQSIEMPKSFAREIVDVHVTPKGRLWVIDRRLQTPHQTRITKWDSSASRPQSEFEENEVFGELALNDLNFAMQIGERLFVCGEGTSSGRAGVLEYHCDRHAWTRRSTEPVTATLRSPDGESFYVGTARSVDQFPSGQHWSFDKVIEASPVRRLLWGRPGEILAQLDDDRIFSLRRDQRPVEVFHAPATRIDLATVHAAFDLDGRHILLVSPQGAVLHDTRTRDYQDRPIPAEHKWLSEPGLKFAVSGRSAFFQSKDGRVHALPLRSLIEKSEWLNEHRNHQVAPGSALALMPMSAGYVAVLDAAGVLHRVASGSGPVALGGRPIPDATGKNLVPVDVAGPPDGSLKDRDTAFLFPSQLTVYRSDQRTAQSYPLPKGKAVHELATVRDRLLMTSSDGDVFDFRTRSDRWPPKGTTSILLGGDGGLGPDVDLGISDEDLSDVRLDTDGDLYLAGVGTVVRYSPARRQVTRRWNYPGNGPVQLVGIRNQEPVAVVSGRVYHGEQEKLKPGWQAETVSLFNKQLWITTTGPDGMRRLAWFRDLTDEPNRSFVFFRNSRSAAKVFVDAVPLPEGNVLVSTDSGLRVYSPAARSWYWFEGKSLLAGAELYRIGDYVLAAQRTSGGQYNLAAFHVDSLSVPYSPGRDFLTWTTSMWQPRSAVRAFAVDTTRRDFVFILPDSSVHRWRPGPRNGSGSSTQEIAAAGRTPKANELKRVVLCGSYLVVAGDQVLWTYHTTQHTWRQLKIESNGEARFLIQSLEVESRENPPIERVWCSVRQGGELLTGVWDPETPGNPVTLKSVFKTGSTRFAGNPARVIDVQQTGEFLTLLQSDRVDWFHPGNRRHTGGTPFPGARATDRLTYGLLDGRRVAANTNHRFWLAATTAEFPSRFRYVDIEPDGNTRYAFDRKATVWRRRSDGVVEYCGAGSTSASAYRAFTPSVTPMEIERKDVQRVFQFRERWSILLTADGARIYDETLLREVPVAEVQLAPYSKALSPEEVTWFEEDGSLWIVREGSILQLAGVPRDSKRPVEPSPRHFRGPLDLLKFESGQHWVRTTSGWYFWNAARREFSAVPRTAATQGQPARKLFVQPDVQQTAIDTATGQLLSWNESGIWDSPSSAVLPPGYPTEEIRWLVRDGRAWWVLFDDRVERLAERRPSAVASYRLQTVETFALPIAIQNGLNARTPAVRVTDRGVEFLGVRSGCSVRRRREASLSDGTIRFDGGLQWWTSRVEDVPFAKQLDPQAGFVFFDEMQQCGWLVTGSQSRFFVLDTDTSGGGNSAKAGSKLQGGTVVDEPVDRIAIRPVAGAASSSRRFATVLWSQHCQLDAATRRMLAGDRLQLSLAGFNLTPLQSSPNGDVWASVRTKDTGQAVLSRRIPVASTEPLLAVPAGASLRLLARGELSVSSGAAATWYQAQRDDVDVLWTPASGLDLTNARVSSDTVVLRETPDASAPPVGLLRKGTPIDVVEVNNGWAQLCLTECEVGWLPESAVTIEAGGRWLQPARGATRRDRAFRQQLAAARIELRTDSPLASVIRETQQTATRIRSAAPQAVTSELARKDWLPLVGKVPNGHSAWQAVTGLVIRDGFLWAARSGQDVQLAPAGAFLDAKKIAVDPPLDLAWLKWNHEAKSFEMSCVGGMKSFSPTKMLVRDSENGTQFLFEPAAGLVYRENGKPFVSNRHGIWQYSTDRLSLTQKKTGSVVFQPHESAVAPQPFVGGFVDGRGHFIKAVSGMPVAPGHSGRHDVPIGAVTFTESAQRTALQVTLARTDGTPVPGPVLSDSGFAWDHRRSLAINTKGLLLQSDAGLHQHASVSPGRFTAAPAETGRLFSEDQKTAWFESSDEWRRQSSPGGVWAKSASPRLGRDLARSAGWLWRRSTEGEVTITCAGPAVGFRLIEDGANPVYFTSDLLGDAAAHDGELHLVTQAAHQFETLPAKTPAALALGHSLNQGKHRAALPADVNLNTIDLDVRRNRQFGVGGTGEVLYRIIEDETSAWNQSRARFEPVAASNESATSDDPHVLQRLAGTGRLRFWRRNEARIQKDVRLDQPAGGSGWVTFRFSACSGPDGQQQNRFPFDRARSVAARFGRLFIGTDAGLQITSEADALARRFDLHQPNLKLLDVRNPETVSAAEPVNRVGIPLEARDVLAVRAQSRCLVTKDGATFTTRSSRDFLDKRLRLQSVLWQWREERRAAGEGRAASAKPASSSPAAAVRLTGRYINEQRAYASGPIDFTGGRLPHDRVTDVTHFDGQTFTLWHNGWITAHRGDEADLDAGFTNFDRRATGPVDMFVVRHRNLRLQTGLYYRNETRQVWRYDVSANGWDRVSAADEVQRLIEYAAGRPVFSEDRMKLVRKPDGRFEFQHRTLPTSAQPHGRWREIPWQQRHGSVTGMVAAKFCLACDQWTEFVHDDQTDTLWAATPMGFCRFRRVSGSSRRPTTGTTQPRTAAGRVELRLDEFYAAREHADGKHPPVTELRIESSSKRRKDTRPLLFRRGYDSRQVYEATLDPSRDTGVLPQKPQSGENFADPFAESEQVTTDYWEWRLTNRSGAHASGARRSQPGRLVGRLFTARRSENESGASQGEEIELRSGRFLFDSPASLLADGESVQLVTPVADKTSCVGWLSISGDDLHLRHWKRPIQDGDVSTTVLRIFLGRNTNGSPVTGLLLNNGRTVTVTGQKTQDIPPRIAAGGDGFWNYSQILLKRSREITKNRPLPKSPQSSGALIVDVTESRNGVARRTLEDGQFTDDIVTGLPVQRDAVAADGDPSGLEYVLPTRAGIEQRQAAFERIAVFQPTPESAAELSHLDQSDLGTSALTVLYVDHENHVHSVRGQGGNSTAAQLVREDFFNRETDDTDSDDHPALRSSAVSERVPVSITLPSSAAPLSASRDLTGHIRLRWKQPGTCGWSLIPDGNPIDSVGDSVESVPSLAASDSTNTMILPVGDWRRFKQNRYQWGNPPPVLALQFSQRNHRLSFATSETADRGRHIAAPDQPLVNVMTFGSRLLLISKQETHQLELNRPLVTAFSEERDNGSD